MLNLSTLPDDPRRTADHGHLHHEATLPTAEISDDKIVEILCDLFAGRTKRAFGEDLEWWAETFQCDLGPQAACGLVLVALSDHPADVRAGAGGVSELRTLLLERAHMLSARSGTKEQA